MATESGRVRPRQVRLLLTPSWRSIRWAPLAAVALLAGAAVVVSTRAPEPPPDGGLAAAAALLALWSGSLLGDPTATLTAGLPTPLWFRRLVRLALGVPPAVAVWAALLVWADPGPHEVTLTMMFLAQMALAIGVAAAALRTLDAGREVPVVAAGLFIVFVVLPFTFEVDLAPTPSADTWWLHAGRWLTIAGAGLAAFVVASRDAAHMPTGPLIARVLHPAQAVTPAP